jgi:type IV secretory pathway TrbD component
MTPNTDQWAAPVYHALAEPFLIGGVPPLFGLLNALVTIMLTLVVLLLSWWTIGGMLAALGLLTHAVATIGTQREPAWWGMWREYLSYTTYYEA